MHQMCDCERPGYFFTGVPGVLAAMQDGRVAPGAIVERCDQCQRFPTDVAALTALAERGLTDRSLGDGNSRSFTVHCYAVVRIPFPGVVAPNEKEAAAQVLDRFEWDVHGRSAEFAEEFTELMVDSDRNGRHERSVRFTQTLEVIEP